MLDITRKLEFMMGKWFAWFPGKWVTTNASGAVLSPGTFRVVTYLNLPRPCEDGALDSHLTNKEIMTWEGKQARSRASTRQSQAVVP